MPYMLLAEAGGAVTVASALADAKTVFEWVMTVITSQPLLTASFAMTVLVPAGVYIFRRITHAV